MGDNRISNISIISSLPYLEYLNIEDNNATDFTPLANLFNLKYLDISESSHFSDTN